MLDARRPPSTTCRHDALKQAGNVQPCPEGERRSRCGLWGGSVLSFPVLPTDVEIKGCFMQLLPGRRGPVKVLLVPRLESLGKLLEMGSGSF